MPGPAAAFELDIDAVVELTRGPERAYSDVTSFPAVLQDIAVVVRRRTCRPPRSRRRSAPAAATLLAGVELFDVYRGEQVGEGEKSLALRLEFRAPDRTLTDAEVAERARGDRGRARRARRAAACLSTASPSWEPAASAARCARASCTATRRSS